jgi:sortase A
MNNRIKKIFTYGKMSLLFMVLGAVIIYLGGKPLTEYAVAKASMIIVNGAPKHANSNGELLKPIVESGNASDQSEIRIPVLNTQYGTISCEKIALAAPLYYGDNSYSLQNGAGQYAKSGFPGQGKPILVGGHDGTFFEPLKDIKKGDVVKIETTYGIFEYEVTGIKVADKNDTTAYDLTQKKEQLIIYTCYPFGQLIGERNKRFFVYCNLKSSTIETAK